jgi:hypothetical protein
MESAMPQMFRILARGERQPGLIRLSIGVGRDPGDPVEWRVRHVPTLSLHDRSERVQRLVETVCRDMWGELANQQMTSAAFAALEQSELPAANDPRPPASARSQIRAAV